MESARRAEEEDLAVCRRLLVSALDAAQSMRGGTALTGDHTVDGLLARWTAPVAALYVGVFEHATVGLAAATTFRRGGRVGRSARIECCYVEPGARGVGVGGALMHALVEWCTGRGAGDIDALALPGDRSTKQRLEAAGFTARLLTLNRSLD